MKRNLEEVSIIAMNMISHVGEARAKAEEAITFVIEGNTSQALSAIAEGETWITKAHQEQTNYIQETIMDEDNNVPMLMIHAQDILMSGTDELRNLKTLIRVLGSRNGK